MVDLAATIKTATLALLEGKTASDATTSFFTNASNYASNDSPVLVKNTSHFAANVDMSCISMLSHFAANTNRVERPMCAVATEGEFCVWGSAARHYSAVLAPGDINNTGVWFADWLHPNPDGTLNLWYGVCVDYEYALESTYNDVELIKVEGRTGPGSSTKVAVPPWLKLAKILPTNWKDYLPNDGTYEIPGILTSGGGVGTTHSNKKIAGVGRLWSAQRTYTTLATMLLSDSQWAVSVVQGDSGNVCFIYDGTNVVLVNNYHGVGSGPLLSYYAPLLFKGEQFEYFDLNGYEKTADAVSAWPAVSVTPPIITPPTGGSMTTKSLYFDSVAGTALGDCSTPATATNDVARFIDIESSLLGSFNKYEMHLNGTLDLSPNTGSSYEGYLKLFMHYVGSSNATIVLSGDAVDYSLFDTTWATYLLEPDFDVVASISDVTFVGSPLITNPGVDLPFYTSTDEYGHAYSTTLTLTNVTATDGVFTRLIKINENDLHPDVATTVNLVDSSFTIKPFDAAQVSTAIELYGTSGTNTINITGGNYTITTEFAQHTYLLRLYGATSGVHNTINATGATFTASANSGATSRATKYLVAVYVSKDDRVNLTDCVLSSVDSSATPGYVYDIRATAGLVTLTRTQFHPAKIVGPGFIALVDAKAVGVIASGATAVLPAGSLGSNSDVTVAGTLDAATYSTDISKAPITINAAGILATAKANVTIGVGDLLLGSALGVTLAADGTITVQQSKIATLSAAMTISNGNVALTSGVITLLTGQTITINTGSVAIAISGTGGGGGSGSSYLW